MVRDMTVIRNRDDAISVDLFVQELREEPYDPVLLYKRQHELDQQYSSLPSDAFLLAFQTDFQRELYQQYAHKVLCVDATHGTNAYRFKLITVMVADEYGEGNYKNNDTIFIQIVLWEHFQNLPCSYSSSKYGIIV